MSAGFKVFGIDETIANLLKIGSQIEADTAKAVMDCGQHLKGESQKECPFYTGIYHPGGNLQKSAQVEMVDKNTVEVSYNTDYALIQHERLDFHHTQGKAKYLEDPLTRNRQKYINHIKTGGESGL
jgi:hypothetical protein